MCTEERFNEGIALAGGLKKAADLLGESPQVLTNWRARGSVPPSKCRAFSSITGISLKELRPNDWADYWPDLEESRRRAKVA